MCLITYIPDLMVNAINSALKDERFKLASPKAVEALKMASALILWTGDPSNKRELDTFSINLTSKLRACLVENRTKQLKQAKMWGLFHKLRTSTSFKKEWETFGLKSLGKIVPVGLYQFITLEIFKGCIKEEYPVSKEGESLLNPLTPEEENALRYVAGYVCRSVEDEI